MKLLKKINKGLVLTVIVLVALIIYIVTVEISRSNEKPNIETACKDYIENIQKVYNKEDYSEEQKKAAGEELKRRISRSNG